MHHTILETAALVVARANRARPADSVLRAELARQHRQPAEKKASVSRAVFSYFRWYGWLDRKRSLLKQLAQAVELDEQFALAPENFSDSDLVSKAVPNWLEEVMEVTAPLARALQKKPKLWLRARRGDGPSLAEKLGDCHLPAPERLPETLEYRGVRDLFRTPEFANGEFEIQDLSSQCVGLLCAPQPGQTWWDACAGEGGKTLHLADLMNNKGLIWASDRTEWRLQKLRRRAARACMFNYRIAPWKGSATLPTKTRFDGVLIDAPCSGIGTWQRNPHARWTTTLEDVEELAGVQAQLLAHAAAAIKPGGRLVYAVCTLTRPETSGVVKTFEEKFPEFEPLPLPDPRDLLKPPGARHWFWPQEEGGNGMFVAMWRRKKQ
ncbi:MAG: RsmB/NOP family class I SAM-dependent RNA methyltransferase [Verrucomicrobiota bacterium]